MSSFVKFFILSVCVSFCWITSAKSVEIGFSTGHVVAAEITTAPVEIIHSDKSPVFKAYDKMAYAVVVLKMHSNRSVSPLDYDLTIARRTVPCITAVYNMDSFVVNTHIDPQDPRTAALYPSEKDYVRMLFVFDSSKLNLKSSTIQATLKSNLKSRKNLSFKLNNLGDGNFTDVKEIPENGLLQ